MADTKSLELYFDTLWRLGEGPFSNDPYISDEKRYQLFDSLRSEFAKIGADMHQLETHLTKKYAGYTDILHALGDRFDGFSGISNQDFDYYLRCIAVARLSRHARDAELKLTPEMLECLLEALMAMLYEDGKEVMSLTRETLQHLNNLKISTFLRRKQEALMQGDVKNILQVLEDVEAQLQRANRGILARDRKMLEVLRKLRGELNQKVMSTAIQHTIAKDKIISGIVIGDGPRKLGIGMDDVQKRLEMIAAASRKQPVMGI